MKDKIDENDATFVQGSAVSPLVVQTAALTNNSNDMKLLFGDGLEIKP